MSALTRPCPTLVQVAIAGLGRIGQIHFTNLTALKHVKIVAVYDPSPTAQQWVQDSLQGEEIIFADSFGDLIALPQVHLVWIATPTSEHAEQALAAIEAGKHVFCEKPLSTSVDEARRFLQLASQHPSRLAMCGFSRRFDASYIAAYQAIQSGQIGRVHLIRSRTLDLCMLKDVDGANNVDFFYRYAKSSGGIFLDCLIHDIDLVLYLFGAATDGRIPVPKRVWATGSIEVFRKLQDIGDVDNAVGIIEFWNGRIATLQGSRTMVQGHDTGTEVYGTKGKLTINAVPRDGCLDISTEIGRITPLQQSWWDRFASAFKTEASEVIEAVRTRLMLASNGDNGDSAAQTYPPPRNLTLESSVRVLEIASALTRSLREGREIRFDEDGVVQDHVVER